MHRFKTLVREGCENMSINITMTDSTANETRRLIQMLEENVKQLKEEYNIRDVPHFREPYDEESPMSKLFPAVSFEHDAFYSEDSLYSSFLQMHGRVSLKIISKESKSNIQFRHLLNFEHKKLTKNELFSIFPIQYDQHMSIEEFSTFINSAKEYLANKNTPTKIDIYRDEDKERIEFYKRVFNEWSEGNGLIDKFLLLRKLHEERNNGNFLIEDEIRVENLGEKISFTDFLKLFDIYPLSPTFNTKIEDNPAPSTTEFTEEDLKTLENLFASLDFHNIGAVDTQEFVRRALEIGNKKQFDLKIVRDKTAEELIKSLKNKLTSWENILKLFYGGNHEGYFKPFPLSVAIPTDGHCQFAYEKHVLSMKSNFEGTIRPYKLTEKQKSLWKSTANKFEKKLEYAKQERTQNMTQSYKLSYSKKGKPLTMDEIQMMARVYNRSVPWKTQATKSNIGRFDNPRDLGLAYTFNGID